MIHRHKILPSTNDEAMRLACECGALAFDAVMADEQSAGRGRLGRAWSSPAGTGLYASVILRPRIAPENVPSLTLLAGVAAAEAIHDTARVPARIKWPNDILINGKKVAGLLCEAQFIGDNAIVIAGLGVNVNTLPRDLPERVLYPATSLLSESGISHEPLAILEAWIERLRHWIGVVENGGGAVMFSRWMELDALAGRKIRVGETEGVNVGLDAEGRLLVRLDDGEITRVSVGDVS
ncbi:MAG: biotin--[acetyl-CoA-carboxylase] ligase [Kiritimatiellaeota bacterium]|nr:biotin--[acetyl-CoA-carboxylase] ligase [Kiritimatiellota bacterium]